MISNVQVTYHALQSIFQHLHLTKSTRTGPAPGASLAARTAGALPQPNGMGMGGTGLAASYPAAVNSGGGRPQIQNDILAVFNASNAQASEVGTSTDQASLFHCAWQTIGCKGSALLMVAPCCKGPCCPHR